MCQGNVLIPTFDKSDTTLLFLKTEYLFKVRWIFEEKKKFAKQNSKLKLDKLESIL